MSENVSLQLSIYFEVYYFHKISEQTRHINDTFITHANRLIDKKLTIHVKCFLSFIMMLSLTNIA